MSTLHRSRKDELSYRHYLKSHVQPKGICVFCELKGDDHQIIREFPQFYVIKNIFPYSVWDSSIVRDHLMIVPKRHIESTSKFSDKETLEHHKITAIYEKNGYDLYSRGVSSTMKSVQHQHTHIIKTTGEQIRGLVFMDKPFFHKIMKQSK